MQNDDIEIFPKDEEEATKLVREFIRKTRRFEWLVNTEKANNIFPPSNNNLIPSRLIRNVPTPKSLGTILASSLEHYRNITNVVEKGYQAKIVAKWINYALDQGVISQGDGLSGKLDDCKKEQTRLENELILVSKKFEKLEETNKTMEDELKIFHEKYGKPKL